MLPNDIPALNEHLAELQLRLNGDLTPLMQAIGSVLEGSTRQRFEDEQDPDGVSWTVLMPSTVRAKRGYTGILKGKSPRSEGGRGNSMEGGLMQTIRWEATSDTLVLGTDKPYGKYHQTGTRHMPRRAFLGLSEDDKTDIGDLINDFLAGDL